MLRTIKKMNKKNEKEQREGLLKLQERKNEEKK